MLITNMETSLAFIGHWQVDWAEMQLQEEFAPVSASLLLDSSFEDCIYRDPKGNAIHLFYYLASMYFPIPYAKHDGNAKANQRQNPFRNHTSFLFLLIFLSYNFSFGCH